MRRDHRYILCAVLSLLACTAEKQPTYLTVSEPGSLTAEAQSVAISVSCDVDWSVSVEEGSWMEIGGKDGSGFTLSLPLNRSEESRSGSLVVKAGKLQKKVSVIQDGLSSIVKPLSLTLRGTEPGRIDVRIQSSWTATEGEGDWYTVSKERSAAGSTYLLVTPADGNENTGERRSALVITFGGESITVPVIQGQTDVLYGDDALVANGKAADYTIETSTNVEYEVVIPASAPWISHVSTKSLDRKETVIHLAENNTGEARSATLTLKGGNAEKTFSVRQFFMHPVLDKTALGGYGVDGNDYICRDGIDQWSWRVRGGTRTFLVLDQQDSRVLAVSGIPETLELGTVFGATVTVFDGMALPVETMTPLTVVGLDGSTCWLAGGEAGFIIHKNTL